MADTTVRLGGKSRDEVALELLYLVSRGEGKILTTANAADRHYILSTYYQCWLVANGSNPKELLSQRQ